MSLVNYKLTNDVAIRINFIHDPFNNSFSNFWFLLNFEFGSGFHDGWLNWSQYKGWKGTNGDAPVPVVQVSILFRICRRMALKSSATSDIADRAYPVAYG